MCQRDEVAIGGVTPFDCLLSDGDPRYVARYQAAADGGGGAISKLARIPNETSRAEGTVLAHYSNAMCSLLHSQLTYASGIVRPVSGRTVFITVRDSKMENVGLKSVPQPALKKGKRPLASLKSLVLRQRFGPAVLQRLK